MSTGEPVADFRGNWRATNRTEPDLGQSVDRLAHAAPPNASGVKHDAGKPTFDLLPIESLAEIQRVLDFGSEKYAAWNWAKGMNWLRLWNATMRHLFAWVRGQDIDAESGLPHLAHAGCNILFLISYASSGVGSDDRRKHT